MDAVFLWRGLRRRAKSKLSTYCSKEAPLGTYTVQISLWQIWEMRRPVIKTPRLYHPGELFFFPNKGRNLWPASPTRKLHTLHAAAAAAAAESLQSCPTLCDPTDGSLLGSPVPGILQARTLEWVAISFSNAWKWKAKVKSLSRAWLLATPWTAAYQAPPSMGFSRQECWSGVPLPSPNTLHKSMQ